MESIRLELFTSSHMVGQLLQALCVERTFISPIELNLEFTWHLWGKKNEWSTKVCFSLCAVSAHQSLQQCCLVRLSLFGNFPPWSCQNFRPDESKLSGGAIVSTKQHLPAHSHCWPIRLYFPDDSDSVSL